MTLVKICNSGLENFETGDMKYLKFAMPISDKAADSRTWTSVSLCCVWQGIEGVGFRSGPEPHGET
jgi:hypothetical protein